MKTVLYKCSAILTIISIILSVFGALTLVSVAASGVADILGLYDDEDYQNLIDQWILSESGMTAEEFIATYYEDYYDYITNDHWGLASGSGGVYGSDNNFNDSYLEATEQQLAMFFAGNGLPFNWDEFVSYAKKRRAAELNSSSFSTSDYVGSNKLSPVSISGEGLKALYSPWADYYKPMPNTTQYIWSYQTTESTSTAYPYSIGDRDFPLYMESYGTWGKKNWREVYLLPFFCDDGVYYYGNYYQHYYSTKGDDNSVTLHNDYYYLSDGKSHHTTSTEWDVINYPFIGLRFNINWYGSVYPMGFKSYADYMSCSNGNQLYNGYGFGELICFDYSSSTLQFTNLLQSVSFSPSTQSNDDFGFYVSSEPFTLISHQTSIDFEKIPDNYTITINGDTIYDYSITNPDSGETSTINEYVTNNYTYITNNNGDSSGGSSSSGGSGSSVGSVSGDVDVSGKVDVSGDIEIKTNPIDINVNVTTSSPSSGFLPDCPTLEALPDGQQGLGDLIDYYDESADQIGGLFSSFYQILPPEIVNLIPLAVALIIFIGLVRVLH